MQWTKATSWAGLATVAGGLLLGAVADDPRPVPAQSAQTSRTAAAWEQVGGLAGHWKGSAGDERYDEVWLPAEGTAMVGMYRESKAGQLALTEIETIARERDAITLRLRHFNGIELAPWGGEKDGPLTLTLETAEPGHLLFRAPAESRVDAIDYRFEGGEKLTATVSFRGGREPIALAFSRQRG